jgi:predicted transcriptional regulator YdeE
MEGTNVTWKEASQMEPRFETRGAFTVLGVEEDALKIEEVDPGFQDLWMNRFMSRHGEVHPYSTDGAYYAVWFGTRGTDISVGKYLAGMAVGADAKVPESWVRREVPAAAYAVFETTLRDVGDATDYALRQWLPNPGWELDAAKPRFDLMPPDVQGPESPVSVWIPVRRKEAQ